MVHAARMRRKLLAAVDAEPDHAARPPSSAW
jgi:hypothetical protein